MKLDQAVSMAVKEAEKVCGYRFRHGCIVFEKDFIFSKGRNKQRFHPQLRRYGYRKNCWLHAESDALLKCGEQDLRRATLLVLRKSKTKYSNSKPCSCCMAMIREKRIKRVMYTDVSGGLVVIEMKYPLFEETNQ